VTTDGSVGLTSEQRAVVELPRGAWLVTAPPGCGKTEVLVRRVEHLLRSSTRRRSQFLVLTFTRRAAEHVVERVRQAIPTHADRVAAHTFHEFGYQVLRQQAPDLVRHLYEGRAERLLALQSAIEQEGIPLTGSLEDLLQRLELAKKTLAFEAVGALSEEDLGAFNAYTRYQQRERICDYDDLVLDVLELFRINDFRREIYRERFEGILVDEAQDLNASQYELIRELAGQAPRELMLFADYRQSIYAFNGADLALLQRFAVEFGAGRRQLTLSFRCGRQIVRAANVVAARLRRNPDVLSDDRSLAEGELELHEAPDEVAQAEWVGQRLAKLFSDGLPPAACHPGERLSVEPKEVAVLGRSRAGLAFMEGYLRQHVGPIVTSYGRDGALSSHLGRAALWMLRTRAHPRDVIVRRQFLSAAGLNASDDIVPDISAAAAILRASQNPFMASLGSLLVEGEDAVGETLDLLAASQASVADPEDADALASDVAWLRRVHAQLRRRLQRFPRAAEFTQEVTLTAASPLDGPGVRVLTVHAAKGLEFRVVAIIGLRDGAFPAFRSTTEVELQEERRLAYVAITRASRVLLACWPKTWITSYGNIRHSSASPYFVELAHLTRRP
jgi:DNA helicase II / ATP-dependent DNA helicase PcrA